MTHPTTLAESWTQAQADAPIDPRATPAIQARRDYMAGALDCLVLQSRGATAGRCWCHTCRPVSMTPPEDMRMVICPDCGNKRCPKAMHHDHYCTSSNATGQLGSAYGADLCRQCVTPKVCTRNQRCLALSA